MALACGVLAASAASQAATFTFNPGSAGLAGAAFSADNLLLTDYLTVYNTSATTFTESGLLSVTGAQLSNSLAPTTGLNSTYGLYIAFSGSGNITSGGNPLTGVTTGSFTSLSFTLYGYNGSAAFGFDGTTPMTTAAAPVVLASGSLINGSVVTLPTGNSFAPAGTATVNLSVLAAPFFASPSPFFNQAQVSFTNTSDQVQLFDGGFMIGNGGGVATFAAAVPEPATPLMLLAGLGAVGWVCARRRQA